MRKASFFLLGGSSQVSLQAMKFGEFGRGPTTPVRGLTITMVVNHLLIGRIFQVIHFRWWISKTWTPPERNTDYFGMFSCLSLTCNLEKVCQFSSLGAPFREKSARFHVPVGWQQNCCEVWEVFFWATENLIVDEMCFPSPFFKTMSILVGFQ